MLNLEPVSRIEVVQCFANARRHGLLALSHPFSWIVVGLVWLVIAF